MKVDQHGGHFPERNSLVCWVHRMILAINFFSLSLEREIAEQKNYGNSKYYRQRIQIVLHGRETYDAKQL